MSEAATTIPETTDAAPVSVAEPQSADEPKNGRASLIDRVKADPDFAANTVKELQRQISQVQKRLKPLEQLEQVAKATYGDVAEGVGNIVTLADRAYRIEQNPQWKNAVDKILAGERVVPTEVAGSEEYLTPEERKIQALEAQLQEVRTQVSQQDTRMSQSELANRLSSFFNSDLGQALEPAEREEMVETLQSQFKQWSSTDSGRNVLRNLQPDTIETVVVSQLHKSGKLASVYERIRNGKDQRRLGAATESPSSLPRGAATESREFRNAADALRHAAKEFMSPEARQRLGW